MLRIGKIILKVIGYIIGSLLALLVLIALLIQTPPVQNFLKEKALSFYKGKVNAEADIGRFWLDFPHDVVIDRLYMEDLQGNTLAYVDEFRVSADMWGLLKGELAVSEIEVGGFVGYMNRSEVDSTFNFNFIVDAFATTDTTATKTKQDTSTFNLTVDAVKIRNARFHYDDPVSGFDMQYRVGNFEVEISKFDLNKMALAISDIKLEDSYGEFIQNKEVPSSDEPTEPFSFDLAVEDVTIDQVRFIFESIPAELKMLANIGHLDGVLEKIDINKMTYYADELNLENSLVELDIRGKSNVDTVQEQPAALDTIILNAGANKFTFNNINFRFDDHTSPEAPGFDPMHFAFSNINGELTDIDYRLEDQDNYVSGEVVGLTLDEEAGMSVEKLNGIVEFTPTYMVGENMELAAGESQFSGNVRLSYSSLDALAASPEEMEIKINGVQSTIHFDDVVYFVPDLKEQVNPLPKQARVVHLHADVDGKLADLDIHDLHLEGLRKTTIDITGNIYGAPNVNDLSADLEIKSFITTLSDLKVFVPDTLLPEEITLPETLALQGNLTGDLQQATANLTMNTSMGDAQLNASLQMKQDSVYAYKGDLAVNSFNIGKLLQQEETMGSISLELSADGEGLSMEDLNTELQGQINSFTYEGYQYENLHINGMMYRKEYSGTLAMNDKNLDFSFEGTVDMNDSIPAFMFYLELNKLDLQALNFSRDEFEVRGSLDSDLKAADLENIIGLMEVKDLVINKGGEEYTLDSLELRSEREGEESNLTINSDFMTAQFNGQFEVVNLPQVIKAHINQYYELVDDPSIEGISPQSFTFNIDIFDTELMEVLVPDLETLEVEEISGTYDSEEWFMDILVDVPQFDYAGMKIDTLEVNLASNEEEMNYDVRVASMQTGISIKNIWLEGLVASNHINTALHIQNEAGEDKFLYGGIFTTWEEQYYQLQLTPGRVIMDYEEWEVYPGNSIQFYPSGIIIEDLRLSHEEQQLNVESVINAEQDTLINLNFSRFNVATLAEIAQQDTATILSGIINGSAELNTSAEALAFTSDLGIQNFAYQRDTLGNFSLKAYSSGGDRYNVTASLDGQNNQMIVEGYYEADSAAGILHFDANMEALSFKAVELFSMGELSQSRGYLSGNLSVRGTVNKPNIDGALNFNNVSTNVTYLKAWMMIDDEEINFDNRGIHLNNFTINDGSGNDFTVNGDLLTSDYQFFQLNINAQMRDFLLMNTGAGDNPLFYGTLLADSDIRVTGNSELPVINMNIGLNNESRITYIVPEAELVSIEREGLIKFMDRELIEQQRRQDTVVIEDEKENVAESRFRGIDFTANIEIDNSNEFTVVIDPATGDRLNNLRGAATLALSINPTGDITLNGRYTVEEGTYLMRMFGLARREFSIVGGSYLLWTGDPLDAMLNLTAQYEVLASIQPLIANQPIAGVNQYAKQPILVNLNLEGNLLSPEISFNLSMPEEERRSDIMFYLQEINNQESRVLEEVLSLVVFRRFSGGNILAGGGAGPESTARQSVSRVLSQQLNQLGGRIGGVNLTFDVQSYEDYSQTGDPYNRTDVELGLSTKFFDDRVNVKVAGNINVEGETAREQSNMNDFAGDVIVEYLITRDGRFRLMGFRRNEYDDLLQGEIMETGIGLIFVRDYDSLNELFQDINRGGG